MTTIPRLSGGVVSVAPYTAKHGFYANAIPDVLVAPLEEGRPVPMLYGNPFPRDWPFVVGFSSYSTVSYSLNGTQPWGATGILGSTARELTVPPGVLVSGATYVARIRSLREGNVDLGKYLFRQGFPNAYAFTGILRAP